MCPVIVFEGDYLHFVHGLALAVLAAASFGLAGGSRSGLPWGLLAAAGAALAGYHWLQVLALGREQIGWLDELGRGLLLVALLPLLEFGRRGLGNRSGTVGARGRGWAGPLLLTAGVALAGAAGSVAGLTAVHLALALTALPLAGALLYRAGQQATGPSRAPLRAAGALVVVYGLLAGLGLAAELYGRAAGGGQEAGTAPFVLPLLALRTLTLLGVAAAVATCWETLTCPAADPRYGAVRSRISVCVGLSLLSLVLLGWVWTNHFGAVRAAELERGLIVRALTAGGMLTSQLQERPEAALHQNSSLQAQLDALCSTNPTCEAAYLAAAEPEGLRLVMVANQAHHRAEQALAELPETLRGSVGGGQTEEGQPALLAVRWGTGPWVTTLTPVAAVEQEAYRSLVLGLSIPTAIWQEQIAAHRRWGMLLTLGLCLLTALLFVAAQRMADAAAITAASERRYRTLIEGSPHWVSLFDAQGRLQTLNQAGRELLGGPPEQHLGRALPELLGCCSTGPCAQSLEQALQGTAAGVDCTYALRPDGQRLRLSGKLNPLSDEAGGIAGLVGVFTDVTAQRQAEAALRGSEKRFSTAFFSSPALMAMVRRRDLLLTEVNTSFTAISGHTRDEAVGRSVLTLGLFDDSEQLAQLSHCLDQQGAVRNLQMRFRVKSGELRHGLLSADVMEVDGEPFTLAVINDVTESKQAEARVRASEERFRVLFEASRDAVMTLAPPTWQFTSANPATLEMFGAPEEQAFTSLGPWQLSPATQPDGTPSADKARQMIERAMRDGSHFFDWTHQRLDGEPFPSTVLLTRMEVHGQTFLQATVRDVTAQQQAAAALRESEQRLSATLRSIGDGVVSTDADGRVTHLNAVAEALTGWTSAEAQGMPIGEVFHIRNSRTGEPAENPVPRALAEGRIIGLANDTALVSRAGVERQIADSCAPIRDASGAVIGAVLVFRDVTEEYQRIAELRESRERFGQVAALSREMIWEVDAEGLYTYVSRACSELLGYTEDDLVGKRHFHDLFPAEEREALRAEIRQMMVRRETMTDFHNPLVTKDGRILHVLSTAVPIVDQAGQLVGYRGADRDITQLKQTERRIAESVEHLQVLTQIGQALSSTLDPDSVLRIVLYEVARAVPADHISVAIAQEQSSLLRLVSPGLSTPRGVRAGEPGNEIPLGDTLLGRVMERQEALYLANLGEVMTPWERKLATEGLGSALLLPIVAEGLCLGTINVARRGPEAFSFRERELLEALTPYVATALRNARAYGQLRQARAELEAAQQQVVRVERLRSIGEVASGVAHDFNNLLATIIGRTQLLLLMADEETAASLRVIETAARDGRDTVKHIQQFVRRSDEENLVPADLDELVEHTLAITRHRWKDEAEKEGVVITARACLGAAPVVLANTAEIREVLTNFIHNACDAIADSGRITVSTRVEDPWGVVEVADDGCGMDEPTRERIFDLFFTTKGADSTGLGLAISQGIIQRHGGKLQVESAPGQGSRFTLRLPLADQLPDRSEEEALPVMGEQLQVLVVDDDPMVRETMAEAIGFLGYHAVTAADGPSGLRAVQSGQFDLVITDLGMPGMSGWQVAEKVKALAPQTEVVMLTGWGDSVEPHASVAETLAKPLELADLRDLLARVAQRQQAA